MKKKPEKKQKNKEKKQNIIPKGFPKPEKGPKW